MPRQHDNLERLCNKLAHRLGQTDPLFLQAKSELETHTVSRNMAPIRHDWSKRYDAVIKSWRTDFHTQFHH